MRSRKLPTMICLLGHLTLFLMVSLSLSASPPAPDAQFEAVTLTDGIPDGLPNPSSLVQYANHTVSAGREIACFLQPHPPQRHLRLISYTDCYAGMARGLLLGDDVMYPLRWTKDKLPTTWAVGTCMIILDEKDGAPGRLQRAEIAHVAALVTRICVTHNDDPLGGQTSIGDRNQFTVTVYGRQWQRVERASTPRV